MKTFALSLLLITSCSWLCAEEVPIDTFIESKLKEYQIPGAAVVIVEEGVAPRVHCFGVADLSTGQKVNADTRFQLASVTKTFTGLLFGAAMDNKEIGLEQPVKEVFPQFHLHDAYATQWATEPDLLSHRSGLPAFAGGLLEMLGFNAHEIIQKIPDIKPKTSFRDHSAYSNIGYFLAGEGTARAAKVPWFTLVKTRILTPLFMNDTGLAADIMTSSANVAKPYAKNPEGVIIPIEPNYQPVLQPAGALASTGNDMGKYLQMWLDEGRGPGGEVISRKSHQELLTPLIAEDPGFAELPPISMRSGFDYTNGGWGEYHFQNHRVFEKGGALEGYRTVVVLVPDKKWGVAILSNRNLSVFPEAVRAELLERLLGRSGEDLQKQIQKRSLAIDKMVEPVRPPSDAVPTKLPLSKFEGTFISPHYGQWEIALKDDELVVTAGPAKLQGKLIPWDGDDFLLVWPLVNAGKDFVKFNVTNGNVNTFTYDNFSFRRH